MKKIEKLYELTKKRAKKDKAFREDINSIFTRKFQSPSWAYPPEHFATTIGLAHVFETEGMEDEQERVAYESTKRLAVFFHRYDCQVYSIHEKVLEMLLRKPFKTKDFYMNDLKWPYPSFMLCFPRGNTVGFNGKEIAHIVVTKQDKDFGYEDGRMDSDAFGITVEHSDSTGFFFNRHIDLMKGDTLADFVGKLDLEEEGGNVGEVVNAVNMILKIITFITAMPIAVLPEKSLGTPRKSKTNKPYYQPHIIGVAPKTRYDGESVPGASGFVFPNGWRSAHEKTVHYGPGKKLSKIIMVEAYEIAKHKKEERKTMEVV
jgi:hypothetical protein